MIYTSPYRPIENLTEENVITQFFKTQSCDENGTAFSEFPSNKSLTYKEAKDAVYKFAYYLQTEHNIKKGDVVMLSTLNSLYLQAVHFGAILLGAAISPSNIMYNGEELAHQVRVTKPKLIIYNDFKQKEVDESLKLSKHSCPVITLENVIEKVEALIKDPSAKHAKAADVVASEQDAYYCFSSGTSGLPKGVITTQANIYANTLQQVAIDGVILTRSHVMGAPLPMSHIYGLCLFIWALPNTGKHTVIFPKFDFGDVLAGIIKYQIQTLFAVPPIIVGMSKSPELEKVAPALRKSLRVIQSGAAPLSREAVGVFRERFPDVTVIQGYGMTELSPVSHTVGSKSLEYYDPSSVGWLVSSTEMRLVDAETGKDVPEGGRGEVWIRGPQVMKGYLNNKAATDECLTPDKWLRTGDIGLVGEHGQVYIVDRIKELIKSKGHQVAPAELEGLLLQHKDVLDAVVVGVFSKDQSTEMPRAYVQLAQGADPLTVVKWFNKKVAVHKRLWGGLVKVDSVAKNPSGKILRKEYRGRNDTEIYGESLVKL